MNCNRAHAPMNCWATGNGFNNPGAKTIDTIETIETGVVGIDRYVGEFYNYSPSQSKVINQHNKYFMLHRLIQKIKSSQKLLEVAKVAVSVLGLFC